MSRPPPSTSRFSILLTSLLVAGFGQGCVMRAYGEASYGETEYEESSGEVEETTQFDADELADDDETAIVTFRPVLEAHGMWVDDPSYGLVWVPNRAIVGADFQPYVTAGHWSYTDEGYYWVSDYSWGWAPFHYGRWIFTASYGWAWIPGARYAPAWVEWRYGGGYLGWAPARPGWYWRGGRSVVWSTNYEPGYVYCPHDRFFDREPNVHVIAGSRQPSLGSSTQPWTPPARSPSGSGMKPGRTFQGPDPKVVGIADERVSGARYVIPRQAQPSGIQWKPAPSSRVPDPARPRPSSPGGVRSPSGTRTAPGAQPVSKPRLEEPPIRPPTAPVSGPRYTPGPTTRPATQPVAKPISRPAPVSRPVSAPVSRPVTKPVARPISKPRR